MRSVSRASKGRCSAARYEMIGSEAVNGQVLHDGDYAVVVGVEYSEEYWTMRGSELHYDVSFEQSAARNAHVEVAALDALTGRFLPELSVQATLLRDRRAVGMAQPFMWHPWPLARDILFRPIDTTFTGVKIATGEK